AIAWLEIDDYPPNVDGKTKISPPQAGVRSYYGTLVEKGAWLELLGQTEIEIYEFPFWLDLQWYCVTALKRLGSKYDFARLAVTSECEILLRRLPDLVEFQFSDGQSF